MMDEQKTDYIALAEQCLSEYETWKDVGIEPVAAAAAIAQAQELRRIADALEKLAVRIEELEQQRDMLRKALIDLVTELENEGDDEWYDQTNEQGKGNFVARARFALAAVGVSDDE